jgi:glycosyltransferase involved in cell wall biosynthesis
VCSSDPVSQVLGRSWVLVNTSAREGLPNAFIEAAAHQCAILSEVDPDSFASRFGYHAADGDFAQGLAALLENDLWRERAAEGYAHVKAHFAAESAIQQHLAVYQKVMENRR